MAFLNQAQEILDYIASKAGIDKFQLDGEGRAFFDANDLTFVFYALEEEAVLITVIYIGQPDLNDNDLLYNILCSNHLWEFTGGGNLSIDKDTGHLCLHHRLDLPLDDMTAVEPLFAGLLGASEYWKDMLDKLGKGSGEKSSGTDSQNFIRV